MISLKKWRLFPRSLRQLVVMAFWLVLLPLLVLAYQAYQSLDQLSTKAAKINSSTLSDAHRSEAMVGIALEMERSYRQYCVLGDDRLKRLYQHQYRQYMNMLGSQMAVLANAEYTKKFDKLLSGLVNISCSNGLPEPTSLKLLREFSETNSLMVQETRKIIFSRGEQLQKSIADKGRFFGWQSLILFLLSAFLITLFTRMIIGPVKGIERMINRLGEGQSLENQIDSFKGPRELRSLAQRIIWLSERLSWLESQRHEFLRHISHELKTPLASMREGAELLADEIAGPLTVDQKEVVSILNSSSKHLQRLIEQLLEYNRKLADGPAEHQVVSLKEIVDGVVLSHQLPARIKNIHTEIQMDMDYCWAEPGLLMRVIDNLYSNAVHYGAESGNIWIFSRQVGKNLQIDVANTGTPIPELEKSMIFEPFYQGKLQRKGAVKGSGLGLSIAQDCIKQMQGELHLIESEFADVCFRVELPLTAEND
ncbi:HAMP domain-containing sensor histidine kinase [Xenorhabdus sp. XENO-10]|uniref:histidine kinase n=1 Tax=Xenorhabdus yunnanensis TaxID=3025878 RepID=A0ABT5LF55_9GAMM|nr:HAMP domain-containing sensor histidine kinase [Xenorhabdus yunnanensis]MDC9589731.1 HAMP domain-containing sensor histidine kinase [Xenorhabdus yunnanensis]